MSKWKTKYHCVSVPFVHIFASFCDVTIASAEFLAQKMFGYFGSIVYFIIMPGRKFHPWENWLALVHWVLTQNKQLHVSLASE